MIPVICLKSIPVNCDSQLKSNNQLVNRSEELIRNDFHTTINTILNAYRLLRSLDGHWSETQSKRFSRIYDENRCGRLSLEATLWNLHCEHAAKLILFEHRLNAAWKSNKGINYSGSNWWASISIKQKPANYLKYQIYSASSGSRNGTIQGCTSSWMHSIWMIQRAHKPIVEFLQDCSSRLRRTREYQIPFVENRFQRMNMIGRIQRLANCKLRASKERRLSETL